MLEDDTKKELAFVYEGVFTFDIKENDNDRVVIKSIEQHLKNYKKVALYGAGQLLNYFLRYSPGFMEGIEVIVDDKEALWGTVIHDKKVIPLQELPRDIEAVFICIHQTHLVEKLINNLQKSGKSIKIETLKSLYDFDLVGLSPKALRKRVEEVYTDFHIPAGKSVRFCIYKAFSYDGSDQDARLASMLADILNDKAMHTVGNQELKAYLQSLEPRLTDLFAGDETSTVLILETEFLRIQTLLEEYPNAVTLAILENENWRSLPRKVWQIYDQNVIYPVVIPSISFEHDLDFLLLDLPARYMAMAPNGLGYVHNLLSTLDIKHQTADFDIVFYHRFHTKRIMDGMEHLCTRQGYEVKEDPWDMESADEWEKLEFIEYFRDEIEEIIQKLIEASPKIVGISLHHTNQIMANEILTRVKALKPEIMVLAGGYDCANHTLAKNVLAEECYDYVFIGEADMTMPDVVKKILNGETPKNLEGVISRYDDENFVWTPAPLLLNLDEIDFPKYQWYGVGIYRNYNGYQLMPIAASRGCRWSKCTFCAECFSWRNNSAIYMADQFEWLYNEGCDLFHFNESDLNGDPTALGNICKEIIKRDLKIRLVGQLRIHPESTLEYFQLLKAGGFVHLRFGVDGWSKNTLRLQKKGYPKKTVTQNLRDAHASGIRVTTNMVLGVPNETDEDIDESIAFVIENKPYIDMMENINTLMLAAGSLYYENPEQFGIHFRGDKESIYAKYPKMIPADLWYSETPYIDNHIRLERYQKVCDALFDAGVQFGEYAKWAAKRHMEQLQNNHTGSNG
ncbi:MAG: hypothetical protein A3D90_03030 [Sulfuricurvum sp. RIFCSPHIGHO2_02_FULL_43_9]|nr:MAG: hypothetical protein A3D90_03030 [Sulfuricurvum sp. RIFCSPHIGHO2_02_FULL_43_9]